jgi:endonuclease/exonuclease/phosphatase family metal-dependent hydrolase
MRRRVSRECTSVFVRPVMAGIFLAATAVVASAQTTVTLSDETKVVYATLRSGSYANTNIRTLETRAADAGSDFQRRAMLKFDTENGIPSGANVTAATLTVTVKDASDDATRRVAAYQVTNSWDQNVVTWNKRKSGMSWGTAGGDLGTRLSVANVGNAAGTKVTFDVTSLVKSAVAGNLGSSRYTRIALVDLDDSTNESWRMYYTPSDSSSRPSLKVTYGGSAPATPPPPSVSGSSGSTLRVLEYNVHHGGYGTDGVYDANRVVNVIVKATPDIVSLVEMEKNDSWVSTDGVALYKSLLEQKTGVKWYTWDIQDYGDWSAAGIRNAIISKIPFSASYRHEFSVGKDRTVGGVTISVNGRNINIMSTHFDPDSSSNRQTEAKELVSYAKGFAEDRILTGDFNDQADKTSMQTLITNYHDAWAEAVKAGIQKSAPDNPNGYTRNSRIDFVLYSRGEAHLTLKSVQVIDTRDGNGYMPSDHRPLLAVFTVN